MKILTTGQSDKIHRKLKMIQEDMNSKGQPWEEKRMEVIRLTQEIAEILAEEAEEIKVSLER